MTMPAIAVWTAWVMTAFMSGVGAADEGWHAARITASKLNIRKMQEGRNIGEYFTNNHMFGGGLLPSGVLCKDPRRAASYSLLSPLIKASVISRQTLSRNCLGGVLKK